jgi:hypothetical protein
VIEKNPENVIGATTVICLPGTVPGR